MKIYVVHKHERGEGSEIAGAFQSKQRAEQIRQRLQARVSAACDEVSVEEIEVDVVPDDAKTIARRRFYGRGPGGGRREVADQCLAEVYGAWHSWQCSNKRKRDGLCTTHAKLKDNGRHVRIPEPVEVEI